MRRTLALAAALALGCGSSAAARTERVEVELPSSPSGAASGALGPSAGRAACRFTLTSIDARLPVHSPGSAAAFAQFETLAQLRVDLRPSPEPFAVEVTSGGLTVHGDLPVDRSRLFLSGGQLFSGVVAPHPTLALEIVAIEAGAARLRIPRGQLPDWIHFEASVAEQLIACGAGMAIEAPRHWPLNDDGEHSLLWGDSVPLRTTPGAAPVALIAPPQGQRVFVRVLERRKDQVKVDFDVAQLRFVGWVPADRVSGHGARGPNLAVGRALTAPTFESAWARLRCPRDVSVWSADATTESAGQLAKGTLFYTLPHGDGHGAIQAVAGTGYRPGPSALLVRMGDVEDCAVP